MNLTYPILATNKNIIITTHYGPDGDAIGSSLALYIHLKNLGYNVHVLIPSKCPEFLSFLPFTETLINFEEEEEKAKKLIQEADIIYCLDYNHFSRTREMQSHLEEAKGKKILIDHHLFPDENAFDFSWSNPEASSTCEMIYYYIFNHKGAEAFTLEMMQLLYTGLVTDTGSFRFDRVSGDVHRILAFFKDQGLEHTPIHEKLFNTWSENRLRFLGHILANRLQTLKEHSWSYIYITEEDFKQFNTRKEDIEGFVNYGLSIQGINRTVLFSQRGNDEVRLSFRSNVDYDVREIAANYFNGGGHKNAAGGTFYGNIEDAIQYFKKEIIN